MPVNDAKKFLVVVASTNFLQTRQILYWKRKQLKILIHGLFIYYQETIIHLFECKVIHKFLNLNKLTVNFNYEVSKKISDIDYEMISLFTY